MTATTPRTAADASFDAVVVGAGFAGLYQLHRLRNLGLTVQVIEAGADVGGTWYWNRYPGARCDVESLEYSYSFSPELEQEWEWTERYAGQPEILRYLRHVAERFDLRRDIRFETRVVSALHQRTDNRWLIRTDRGDTLRATWLVMATGCLSVARRPEIDGLDRFAGPVYHSGDWPQDPIDFSGKRVGVIGTGSSGIQMIPQLAAQAAQVVVFQRTPNFSLPARNGPLDPAQQRRIKADYRAIRAKERRSVAGVASYPNPTLSALEVSADERERMLETAWQEGGTGIGRTFTDTMKDAKANDLVAEFVRAKIREKVTDPAVAERLTPRDHYITAKRICLDTDYFETFNLPHVQLVDVKADPIVAIDETGVRTRSAHYALDALVCATGFDAMTGALLAIDIRTDAGFSLREAWSAGPRTYLGLSVAGLPNCFIITGPGSPSVLSNMVVSIEQHVDWITECIAWMRAQGALRLSATPEAQDAWVAHVNEVADATLFPTANSWYLGANVPGKPRVFMPYLGGVGGYGARCKKVADAGYAGFAVERLPA